MPEVCDLTLLDGQTVKNRWELMALMQICWFGVFLHFENVDLRYT